MIDTHCHLDFAVFDPDREAVIERARAAGVERIVLPSIGVDNFERVLRLCAAHAELHPALGLHPCYPHAREHDLARLDATLAQAAGEVVALGEIGLDFRPPRSGSQRAEPAAQERLLDEQLALARAHELPVLLHVVRAHDQVLKRLRHHRLPRGGIVHAFSGSEQQAREYARLGFKLGVGGAITHPRAQKKRRLVANLPLSWLLLETDAPDMPLDGHQGERNEPARVAEIARLLAQLRAISLAEVEAVSDAGARALLRLG